MDIGARKRALLLGHLNYCASITQFKLHRSLLPLFLHPRLSSFQMISSMAHNWDAAGTLCLAPTGLKAHSNSLHLDICALSCTVPYPLLDCDHKILFPAWREREQSPLDFGSEPTGSAKWIKSICKGALGTKQWMPMTRCFQVGILILVPKTHISPCFSSY